MSLRITVTKDCSHVDSAATCSSHDRLTVTTQGQGATTNFATAGAGDLPTRGAIDSQSDHDSKWWSQGRTERTNITCDIVIIFQMKRFQVAHGGKVIGKRPSESVGIEPHLCHLGQCRHLRWK